MTPNATATIRCSPPVTVAELVGLILGVATRLAAVGGLLLIGPIWLMLLHTAGYQWEYPPEDLFPLILLAIVPAGRAGGFDRRLAPGSRTAGHSEPLRSSPTGIGT